MLVPKLLLTPLKIRIFGPKTAKIGPKSAFLVILGQILPFLHILSNARPKNNVNKVPRWVFRYVGNKAYDFSSKKKDFLPKNTYLLYTIEPTIDYTNKKMIERMIDGCDGGVLGERNKANMDEESWL